MLSSRRWYGIDVVGVVGVVGVVATGGGGGGGGGVGVGGVALAGGGGGAALARPFFSCLGKGIDFLFFLVKFESNEMKLGENEVEIGKKRLCFKKGTFPVADLVGRGRKLLKTK